MKYYGPWAMCFLPLKVTQSQLVRPLVMPLLSRDSGVYQVS